VQVLQASLTTVVCLCVTVQVLQASLTTVVCLCVTVQVLQASDRQVEQFRAAGHVTGAFLDNLNILSTTAWRINKPVRYASRSFYFSV